MNPTWIKDISEVLKRSAIKKEYISEKQVMLTLH